MTAPSRLTSIASLRDLLDNLNPARMTTAPFQGGRGPSSKHASGRVGQRYKRRQRARS